MPAMPRVAVPAVLALAAVVAGAQPVQFNLEFDGNINGGPLGATGSGSFDRDGMGLNGAELNFQAMPQGFNPLAVDALLTNICPNGFVAEGGTKNLWDLGGGTYQLERVFQWLGVPGSLIEVQAEVTFDSDEQLLTSLMTLNGTYDGPTDLIGIESYSILWLPGSVDGELFEAGTAVVNTASGEDLIVQFASRYTGLASNLDSIQTGTGVFNTRFDGDTLLVDWEGFFAIPAPGPVALLLVAGGALAARRRRAC
jgi:hypothetical protein